MKEVHKPALTANMVMVTDANGQPTTSKNINATELNMLNNILTNVQTQLNAKAESSTVTSHTGDTTIHITAAERTTWNAKQAAITGAATTITASNLTKNMAMVTDSNGKVSASSTISATELEYLNGVSSNIQTQITAAKNKIWMPDYSNGNGTVITSGATVPVNAIGQALLTVDADSPVATVSVVNAVVGSIHHADGLTKINQQFLIPAGSVVKTVGNVTVRYYPLI